MSNGIFLGSEVIVMSVNDARKLINSFPSCSRIDIETLQRRGVLDVLDALRSAVRRHDYEDWKGED